MNAKRLGLVSAITSTVGGGIGAGVGLSVYGGVGEALLISFVCAAAVSAAAWFAIARPAVHEVAMDPKEAVR